MSRAPVLHLLVPQLLRAADLAHQVQPGGYKALETALSRADRFNPQSLFTDDIQGDCDTDNLIARLAGLPTPTGDFPLAALMARAQGFSEVDDDRCWAIASPVLLKPDRDRLLLRPANGQLTDAERESLQAAFADHFSDDILQLEIPANGDWLMAFPAARADVSSTPLTGVMDQPVDDRLPVGEQAGYWHSLANEMQMLLFQQDNDELGFNALWLHGIGRNPQPSSQMQDNGQLQLVGKGALLEAIAVYTGATISESLAQLSIPQLAKSGPDQKILVYLPDIAAAVEAKSLPALQQAYAMLEQTLAQALDWLHAGNLSAILVHPLPGAGFQLTRFSRYRLWRPRMPLNKLWAK